jgi:hypothetical protein
MARCFSCGVETPYALRLPGRYTELPEGKRGRLPYCKAHEADAFARRDGAFAPPRASVEQPKPRAGGKVSVPAPDTGQGALF